MKRVFYATVKRQSLRLLGAAAFFVVIYAERAEAGLLVSSWNLFNQAAVFVDSDIIHSESMIATVGQPPFSATRFNFVGNTSSSATYSFDWSNDSGVFRIDAAHTASHPTASLVQSKSEGHIEFAPAVDSLISLRVQYTYDLPGDYMEGFGTGGVYDVQTSELFAQLSFGGFSVGPTSGSFDQTVTAVIPAGCNCQFVHTMRLTTEATDVAATDSGTVELLIAPIPEPAALAPLLLGAVMLLRRKRRAFGAPEPGTRLPNCMS